MLLLAKHPTLGQQTRNSPTWLTSNQSDTENKQSGLLKIWKASPERQCQQATQSKRPSNKCGIWLFRGPVLLRNRISQGTPGALKIAPSQGEVRAAGGTRS